MKERNTNDFALQCFDRSLSLFYLFIFWTVKMPKIKVSDSKKIKTIMDTFPGEFQSTPKNELYCKLCNVIVQHSKNFFVEKHRSTEKHKKNIDSNEPCSTQKFIVTKSDFNQKLTEAFLSADIPLYKIRNKKLRELFNLIGHPLPSDQTCRNQLPDLVSIKMDRVKNILKGKYFFMVIDESEICGAKYLNILAGILEQPAQTYLVECLPLNASVNAQTILHAVEDTINFLECKCQDFCLLLSDAAPYMISAGKTLHLLYPNVFHVTCTAHLLHNCAMKVKANYINVDLLIAHLKAVTVKNSSRKATFVEIGQPPTPVVTRWGSWLESAFYFSKNFPAVKRIVEGWPGEGKIVTNAKEIVKNKALVKELTEIEANYKQLSNLIEKFESPNFTILEATNELLNINLGRDPCKVHDYLKKRLEKNEILEIVNCSREAISPSIYAFLQKCQATSATVERSFSMLGKMLAKDRNFKPENIKMYAIMYINSIEI